MARVFSLTARRAFQDGQTDDVAVSLIEIAHSSLPEPVLLSSDPTVRLSDDPLTYGTIHQGAEYLFVMPSLVLPDDEPGQSPKARLSFENVSRNMARLFMGLNDPVEVTIKLVMASTPDNVEFLFRKMIGSRVSGDAGTIALDVGREPFLEMPFPCHRMSKARFPGLHK